MKTHVLKVKSEFYSELDNGNKTCEIRHNDRDFQKGDVVVLCEYNGAAFTGRELRYEITHILSGWGLQENYVALSLGPILIEKSLRCECNPMYSSCVHYAEECPTNGECFKPKPCPSLSCKWRK